MNKTTPHNNQIHFLVQEIPGPVETKPPTEFDQTPSSRAVMQYIRAVNQGGWLARLGLYLPHNYVLNGAHPSDKTRKHCLQLIQPLNKKHLQWILPEHHGSYTPQQETPSTSTVQVDLTIHWILPLNRKYHLILQWILPLNMQDMWNPQQ